MDWIASFFVGDLCYWSHVVYYLYWQRMHWRTGWWTWHEEVWIIMWFAEPVQIWRLLVNFAHFSTFCLIVALFICCSYVGCTALEPVNFEWPVKGYTDGLLPGNLLWILLVQNVITSVPNLSGTKLWPAVPVSMQCTFFHPKSQYSHYHPK